MRPRGVIQPTRRLETFGRPSETVGRPPRNKEHAKRQFYLIVWNPLRATNVMSSDFLFLSWTFLGGPNYTGTQWLDAGRESSEFLCRGLPFCSPIAAISRTQFIYRGPSLRSD